VMRGDDAIGLDRRAGIAWVFDVDRKAMWCVRKRLFGISVTELAIAREVSRKTVVQDRSVWRKRAMRIDNGSMRAILDGDQLGGIFGASAVRRHDHRHRFADIAHAIDRD